MLSREKLQANIRKIKPRTMFIVTTCIMLIFPIVYTGMKLGVFYREPTITTKMTAPADAPVLRIVADKGFKPRNYINKENQSAGSDVEVAIEVANRLGMRPVVKHGEWLECRNLLATGQADVLLGLEIFSNMPDVIKTVPVGYDNLQVYGKNTVTDAAALAGKKVALMGKSVIIANYDLNCQYVEYYTNKDILKAVEDGEADYAICHTSVADHIIKDNGYHLKKGFVLAASFLAFAVREDNAELRDRLNQELYTMAEDGTLQKILQKWNEAPVNLTLAEVLKNNKSNYLFYLIVFLLVEGVFGLCLLLLKQKEQQERYLEVLRCNAEQSAELENARTRLILSQIKPHFIYNTLGTIAYLCQKNPRMAHALTMDFTSYLRGNLAALEASKLIPFTMELNHIQIFLEIECVRYKDSLKVEYDIQVTDFEVPVLCVEPLVENAVEHGVRRKYGGGRVVLSTRKLHNGYQVIIEDDGVGFDISNFDWTNPKQVGLRYVKKRIEMLCGGKLAIESMPGVGTKASITLPMKKT